VPETLDLEQRVHIVLAALEAAGNVVMTAEQSDIAWQAFDKAFDEPGRDHGLDTAWKPGRKPHTPIESYAAGWAAGQKIVKMVTQATRPSPLRRTEQRAAPKRRRRPRRRRDT
jgi:hypothetical protein